VARERLRVRELSNEEGNRLLRIVRRSSGSVVTWRRAQMVLLSAQGMDVEQIARVAFTSPDRVQDVINNFNDDGFESLYPKYSGGRPPTFTLPQRQQIKQIALSRPQDHGLPFSTWSLTKLAEIQSAQTLPDAPLDRASAPIESARQLDLDPIYLVDNLVASSGDDAGRLLGCVYPSTDRIGDFAALRIGNEASEVLVGKQIGKSEVRNPLGLECSVDVAKQEKGVFTLQVLEDQYRVDHVDRSVGDCRDRRALTACEPHVGQVVQTSLGHLEHPR
jgi:transposase